MISRTSHKDKVFAYLAAIVLGRTAKWFEEDPGPIRGAKLKVRSDLQILYCDSNRSLMRINDSGQMAAVTSGGMLDRPYAITASPQGRVFVSDTGRLSIFEFDPDNGHLVLRARSQLLGCPFGLDISPDGILYVANSQAVIGITLATGEQQLVSSVGPIQAMGVACLPDRRLLVADASGKIIEIDLRTRQQSIFAQGGFLAKPVNLIVAQHNVYVADFENARIIDIDLDMKTGEQRLIELPSVVGGAVGLALESPTSLLMGCPDAYDDAGGIVRLNLIDGSVEQVVVGDGELINPRGLLLWRRR
jgi:hypothetical protein